jgi:hypothetical protein
MGAVVDGAIAEHNNAARKRILRLSQNQLQILHIQLFDEIKHKAPAHQMFAKPPDKPFLCDPAVEDVKSNNALNRKSR